MKHRDLFTGICCVLLVGCSDKKAIINDFINQCLGPQLRESPTAKTLPFSVREGQTTPIYYNIRKAPSVSSEIVGKLDGASHGIQILGKKQRSDRHGEDWKQECWYKVVFNDAVGLLKKEQVVWLAAAGVEATESWDDFLAQLTQAEAASLDSFDAKLTTLRQQVTSSELPLDDAFGTPTGAVYLEDRPCLEDAWTLLKGYSSVRTPDGRRVDLQHVIVGLDALRPQHKNRNQVMSRLRIRYDGEWYDEALTPGVPIGANYAATTWAGDVASVVADFIVHKSLEWEKQHPHASSCERFEHYFLTRSQGAELLGDIDAWGITEMLGTPESSTKLHEVLAKYYGDIDPAHRHPRRRKRSIELFLSDYGYDAHLGLGDAALFSQMLHDLTTFAALTYKVRRIQQGANAWQLLSPLSPARQAQIESYSATALVVFLQWLRNTAAETGVRL